MTQWDIDDSVRSTWRILSHLRDVTHDSWSVTRDSYMTLTWFMTLRWFDESCRSHFETSSDVTRDSWVSTSHLPVMYEWRVKSSTSSDVTRDSYMTLRRYSKWDLHDSSNHLRVMMYKTHRRYVKICAWLVTCTWLIEHVSRSVRDSWLVHASVRSTNGGDRT